MATQNAVGNRLDSPFSINGTSVTTTGTQLNYLSGDGITAPNIIIGGNFSTNPWQRGTSFVAIANLTPTYTADRFNYIQDCDGVVSVLKTADAPTASQAGVYSAACAHIDVTTADAAIAAGQYSLYRYYVEGYDISEAGFGQSGTRYITLSFWHKHTKTGTYCVAFKNSAVDRSYVAEYTQAVADTWEKATITIAVDTTGTWLYTNGIGLNISFAIACGSTFQTTANSWQAGNYFATSNQVNALDSTSNNFKIALVKLELGSVATPYPFENEQQLLARCQRYFEKSYPQGSYAGAATAGVGHLVGFSTVTASQTWTSAYYRVTKRATPTITLYSYTLGTAGSVTQDDGSDIAGAADQVSDTGFRVIATNTVGRWAIGFQWYASAEL